MVYHIRVVEFFSSDLFIRSGLSGGRSRPFARAKPKVASPPSPEKRDLHRLHDCRIVQAAQRHGPSSTTSVARGLGGCATTHTRAAAHQTARTASRNRPPRRPSSLSLSWRRCSTSSARLTNTAYRRPWVPFALWFEPDVLDVALPLSRWRRQAPAERSLTRLKELRALISRDQSRSVEIFEERRVATAAAARACGAGWACSLMV